MFFFKKDKNVVKTSYATVLDSLFKFITKIGRGKVRNGGGLEDRGLPKRKDEIQRGACYGHGPGVP